MIEEFPGNSRRPTPHEKPADSATEAPKLDKVVTGKVIVRKKSLGRRLKETFFSTSGDSLLRYLGQEVLLPAMQNLITDFVVQGVEKAVYGEVRSPSRGVRGTSMSPRPHISYNRPTTLRPADVSRPAPRRVTTQRQIFELEDVILATKIEAQIVIDQLYETLEKYGRVTVANLRELIGQTSAYTDHNWGWTDLTDLTARRCREGYELLLPELEDMR